eukprot:365015-Chlamydomonas_euryale.AAC.6
MASLEGGGGGATGGLPGHPTAGIECGTGRMRPGGRPDAPWGPAGCALGAGQACSASVLTRGLPTRTPGNKPQTLSVSQTADLGIAHPRLCSAAGANHSRSHQPSSRIQGSGF